MTRAKNEMIGTKTLRVLAATGFAVCALFAVPSVSPLAPSTAFAKDEEKPDLSDFVPRKSKLPYGKDKEYEKLQKDLEKAKKQRSSVHNVKTCKDFTKLFEKEKTLKRLDTVRVNFSKPCEITKTIVVTKGITIISAKGIDESNFDPYFDQSRAQNYQTVIANRKSAYSHGFLCNTRAAPCFLIDTPTGQRTHLRGLKFTVKQALFAPLVHARSGRLTAKHNLFIGTKDGTGSARLGPSLLTENESSTIEGNTFIEQDTAISVYPYLALRTGEFESAFKIGLNAFTDARTSIRLDGTYRFGNRPEVKVYVFGNLLHYNGVGVSSSDVRAFYYRNIFDDNGAHMEINGGESLIEQNILRISDVAIDTRDPSPIYLESNLFERNAVIAPGILEMFEGGSPYPINNICRSQDLISQYEGDLTIKHVMTNGGRSEIPNGKRRGRKTRVQKAFAQSQAANVQSHILFARPFQLNPADGYKSCFDYSWVVALDQGQLNKSEAKAYLRPDRGGLFGP